MFASGVCLWCLPDGVCCLWCLLWYSACGALLVLAAYDVAYVVSA